MSIGQEVEPAQDRTPKERSDRIADLRRQGLRAFAGVSAVILLLGGYIAKRDFLDSAPLAPPRVFDRFQLLENDKKQIVRLDKTDGSVSVIDEGVVISETIHDRYQTKLGPKTFIWEKLNNGTKVTVNAAYFDKKAFCSIKVEGVPARLEQKLLQAKLGDALYRVQLSTEHETGVIETAFYADLFKKARAADGTLTIEQTCPLKCTAPMFESIRTANIWF